MMTTQVETASGISPEDERELLRMLWMLRTTNGFQLQAAQCDLPVAQKTHTAWR
jgi:hypothetical protein